MLARLDSLDPGGIRDVPGKSTSETLCEAKCRFPAEFTLQFRQVTTCAQSCPGRSTDETNQAEHFGSLSRPVCCARHGAESSHDVDVGSLLVAADVVRLPDLPSLDDRPDGLAVIVDIEPIAAVATGAVNGKLSALEGVQNRERNELLEPATDRSCSSSS